MEISSEVAPTQTRRHANTITRRTLGFDAIPSVLVVGKSSFDALAVIRSLANTIFTALGALGLAGVLVLPLVSEIALALVWFHALSMNAVLLTSRLTVGS